MRIYLTDINKDLHLKEFGYSIINFFSEDDMKEITRLNKICTKNYPTFGLDFSFFNNKSDKIKTAEIIFRDKFESKILQHFIHFKLFGIGFINKGIGIRNEVLLHQDWTTVDESEHQSIACWMPLTAIDRHSGSMSIIPKSHTIDTGIRTLNHPTQTISIFDKRIQKKIKSIKLKPGEGIVYFPTLFHGTYPNHKTWIRRTQVFNLIPEEAVPCFYYKKDGTSAFETFLMPDDFSLEYKKYIIDKGFKQFKKTEDIYKSNEIISQDELIQMIQNLD